MTDKINDIPVTKDEEAIAKAIFVKNGLSKKDISKFNLLQVAVQAVNLPRNKNTASLLRALADFIECPIESIYDKHEKN